MKRKFLMLAGAVVALGLPATALAAGSVSFTGSGSGVNNGSAHVVDAVVGSGSLQADLPPITPKDDENAVADQPVQVSGAF